MAQDLYYLMGQAIIEAKEAFSSGEVPVGAILAYPDGRILARAHNQPIALEDPTAHAEILALRKGGAACRNYRERTSMNLCGSAETSMDGPQEKPRLQARSFGLPKVIPDCPAQTSLSWTDILS